MQRNADKWSSFASQQCLTSYGSSDHFNNLKINSSFSETQHTIQTLPYPTTTFSDCSNMCYIDTDEEVKDMVHMWLHVKLETFYAGGIKKLVDQRNECM